VPVQDPGLKDYVGLRNVPLCHAMPLSPHPQDPISPQLPILSFRSRCLCVGVNVACTGPFLHTNLHTFALRGLRMHLRFARYLRCLPVRSLSG
jgi:hypothetical protein